MDTKVILVGCTKNTDFKELSDFSYELKKILEEKGFNVLLYNKNDIENYLLKEKKYAAIIFTEKNGIRLSSIVKIAKEYKINLINFSTNYSEQFFFKKNKKLDILENQIRRSRRYTYVNISDEEINLKYISLKKGHNKNDDKIIFKYGNNKLYLKLHDSDLFIK